MPEKILNLPHTVHSYPGGPSFTTTVAGGAEIKVGVVGSSTTAGETNRESYASIARSYGISGARVYQIYYRYKIETGSLKV